MNTPECNVYTLIVALVIFLFLFQEITRWSE